MAKKQTSSSDKNKKKTPSAPATVAKKSPAAPAAGGSPLIDTNRAANTAAALVGNRVPLNSPTKPRQESASFKHMKKNIAKPHTQGLSNILDTTNQNKKPSMPFGGGKQVAHNQTFGADVNRAGVPRRTPG